MKIKYKQKIISSLNVWRCQIMIFKHGSPASESSHRSQTLGAAQKDINFSLACKFNLFLSLLKVWGRSDDSDAGEFCLKIIIRHRQTFILETIFCLYLIFHNFLLSYLLCPKLVLCCLPTVRVLKFVLSNNCVLVTYK